MFLFCCDVILKKGHSGQIQPGYAEKDVEKCAFICSIRCAQLRESRAFTSTHRTATWGRQGFTLSHPENILVTFIIKWPIYLLHSCKAEVLRPLVVCVRTWKVALKKSRCLRELMYEFSTKKVVVYSPHVVLNGNTKGNKDILSLYVREVWTSYFVSFANYLVL